MKILYVSELPETHDRKYLETLVKGAEVTLLTFDFRKGFPERFDDIPGLRIIHRETFSGGFHFDETEGLVASLKNRLAVFRARRRMVRAVREAFREVRPDLTLGTIIQNGAWAVHRAGVHPWVAMPWGSDVLVLPGLSEGLKREALDVLRGADHVLANNEHVRKRVLELDAELSGKTSVGPWGIDPGVFHPEGPDRGEELGLKGKKVVLFCRGFRDVYAPEVALSAFRNVSDKVPEMVLLTVGMEEGRIHLEKRGLAERTVLVPPVPNREMPALFRTADLYLQANRSDGESTALQEAMSCGLPVVTTDLPTYRGMLPLPEGGSLVPVDDVETFSSALLEWISLDPEKRKEAGMINRRRILEKFDWRKNRPGLLPLLQEILRKYM